MTPLQPDLDDLKLMLEGAFLYRDAGRMDHAKDLFQCVRAWLPASELPEIGLGTVEFQQGEFQSAQTCYRRALERNPQSALAYAHLGEAQLFGLDRDAARQSLQAALALEPAGPVHDYALNLLKLADEIRYE